jgi:hypothetical protein
MISIHEQTKCMIKLAVAAGCLLTMVRPALAQQADIVGQWAITVTMAQQGPLAPVPLVLRREGDKIVGILSRPQGDLDVEATVKDKAITVSFTVPTQNGPLPVALIGTAEGTGSPATAMSGTMDLGTRGQGQWTARRASAAAQSTSVDVSGAWAFAVEFGGGSGTPTMTFKQDGEKLTGQYVGQLGEAPLSGTIKGAAIEFTMNLTVEGTAVSIRYAGTVDKASMKGTVKFGDMGEGTFTAAKKP